MFGKGGDVSEDQVTGFYTDEEDERAQWRSEELEEEIDDAENIKSYDAGIWRPVCDV